MIKRFSVMKLNDDDYALELTDGVAILIGSLDIVLYRMRKEFEMKD